MSKRKPKPAPKPRNPDDDWQQKGYEHGADAAKDWFEKSLDCKRPIGSITKPEMVRCVTHLIETWIALQARRKAEQKPYDEVIMGWW
jgi:hypothetical protein